MRYLYILFFSSITFSIYSQNVVNKTTIKIHDIKGYGVYETFARASINKLETLINSKEFKEEFFKTKMTQKRGMSKLEILGMILEAKENYGDSNTLNDIDLRLRIMSLEEDGLRWMNNCEIDSKAKTIGKEAGSSGYTITCLQRIKHWAENDDYGSMAGHIMHEYLHNLGFKHRFYSKYKSVVYKTGYLVKDLIREN